MIKAIPIKLHLVKKEPKINRAKKALLSLFYQALNKKCMEIENKLVSNNS